MEIPFDTFHGDPDPLLVGHRDLDEVATLNHPEDSSPGFTDSFHGLLEVYEDHADSCNSSHVYAPVLG